MLIVVKSHPIKKRLFIVGSKHTLPSFAAIGRFPNSRRLSRCRNDTLLRVPRMDRRNSEFSNPGIENKSIGDASLVMRRMVPCYRMPRPSPHRSQPVRVDLVFCLFEDLVSPRPEPPSRLPRTLKTTRLRYGERDTNRNDRQCLHHFHCFRPMGSPEWMGRHGDDYKS